MKFRFLAALLLLAAVVASSQVTREQRLVPTGKGWAQRRRMPWPPHPFPPTRAATSNGIYYHGGPVMPGAVNLYFIWYGNFVNGPASSDSILTQNLLAELFSPGGLGVTPYARINSTYGDSFRRVSGNFALAESANDYYSHGSNLSDAAVAAIVSNAISSRVLPRDAGGVYLVLTSSDVSETSGFCSHYCGWHSHARISGADIKFAFVGNPDRCPNACEEQRISPNGDSGADAMASIMAHETVESISDPALNAWYDRSGNENADKCVWRWGPVTGNLGNGAYNLTAAGHHWLIQMNWENSRGGGCTQRLGGKFYNW